MSDISGAYDAIVVGAGPNGLAAAIELARNGLGVCVFEANETVGGGARTGELTLPGYLHDLGSAVHPLAAASPFFCSLPLQDHGLKWVQPTIPLAHPFDDGSTAMLHYSLEDTCQTLGPDAEAYRKLIQPFVNRWPDLAAEILGPLHLPRHPVLLVRFGLKALQPASRLAHSLFKEKHARGFLAGLAAHSSLPLEKIPTSAIALMLAAPGHVVGWPFPQGGAQQISNALASYFCSLGGTIRTSFCVQSLHQLPPARAVICDLTPRQILQLARRDFTPGYVQALKRYRYGPGVFKMDWALAEPIPWESPLSRGAGTLHLGGTFDEIAAGEAEVWQGRHPQKPFVLLAQQTLADPTRAPQGKHTAWAYCHVPHGSSFDMSNRIEAQIERFAPGFRDCILHRKTTNTLQLENSNPNCVGGDINGGVQDLWQLFTRPAVRLVPYATSHTRIFICSSSTPPGGGVHGMCGYHAARAVLRRVFNHQGDRAKS
ncbi:MAG: phytoene desaturase family protein [Acidobacteriota bacterium]